MLATLGSEADRATHDVRRAGHAATRPCGCFRSPGRSHRPTTNDAPQASTRRRWRPSYFRWTCPRGRRYGGDLGAERRCSQRCAGAPAGDGAAALRGRSGGSWHGGGGRRPAGITPLRPVIELASRPRSPAGAGQPRRPTWRAPAARTPERRAWRPTAWRPPMSRPKRSSCGWPPGACSLPASRWSAATGRSRSCGRSASPNGSTRSSTACSAHPAARAAGTAPPEPRWSPATAGPPRAGRAATHRPGRPGHRPQGADLRRQ